MNRIGKYMESLRNRRHRQLTVKENLKIYQKCVKSYANMEVSALRNYEEEKFFDFFALLLQIVSFFTTYAGVAMYFGNIFDLAPLFIALTIQGVLYLTAISAFRPGRRNRKRKLAVLLCTLVSVAFSYTGLVTLANSPLTDYKRAYESYYDTFLALKQEVAEENLEVESLAANISNEYLKAINTLQALDRRISQLEENANAEITIPSTNRTTQTTTMPDGTVVRGNSTTANPDYAQAVEARQQAASQAAETALLRDELYREILDAVGAADSQQAAASMEEEGSGQAAVSTGEGGSDPSAGSAVEGAETAGNSYDNIRAAIQWEVIAERLLAMTEAADTAEDKADAAEASGKALQSFRQEYFRVANKNNSAVSAMTAWAESSQNLSGYRMQEELLDHGLDQLSIYQEMKRLGIESWDTIAAAGIEEERTGAAGVIDRLGQAIGADMYNSDMKELMECYQKLKEAVVENYSQVTSVLPKADTYERYAELTSAKEQVLALPEILVIAFERFSDPEYAGSAVCCMILALLNDFSTVLLGWLGTRRSYALPMVKSAGENQDDAQELFPVVFTALQSQFVLRIRSGQFLTMDREEFTSECYEYVNSIICMVRSFIACFGLSPCTSAMGYNLVWRYQGEEEIAPYLPVISVLMKAGLLKVLPISQYEYLEMEYYLGRTGHLWVEEIGNEEDLKQQKLKLQEVKEKGHILLLRNQAEHYLREKLSDTIMMEETHE